jgi:spore coat polysaccharide biosynthesis protein SpsF
MKTVATIQARMGSSRLPGKVLRSICGEPVLGHQIRRLSRSSLLSEIVVVTTTEPRDDAIEAFCANWGVAVFRGSETDVLQRVTEGLTRSGADLHVEVTGDSPLIDPAIVDEFVSTQIRQYKAVDAVTSTLKTTYPPGLEVFVYKAEVLQFVNWLVLPDDPLREHAGYNLTRFPEFVRMKSMTAPPDLNRPEVFLEVDTPEDLQVVTAIFEGMDSHSEVFTAAQILTFVDNHPDLLAVNSKVHRRWKALRND